MHVGYQQRCHGRQRDRYAQSSFGDACSLAAKGGDRAAVVVVNGTGFGRRHTMILGHRNHLAAGLKYGVGAHLENARAR